MMSKAHRCASCLAGEIENHDVAGRFAGYIYDEGRPFNGWLCQEHVNMYNDDNGRLGERLLRKTAHPDEAA